MNRILWWRIVALKILIVIIPLISILYILKWILPEARRQYSRNQFTGQVTEWQSKYFRYFSRHPQSREQISLLVENFYRAFRNSYGDKFHMIPFSRKPELLIFGNRKEFRHHHRRKYWSDLKHNAAYYSPINHKITMYWHPNFLEDVLYHELTHMFMDLGLAAYNPQWSPWFSEGIATYFEKSQVVQAAIVPGAVDAEIAQFLQLALVTQTLIPLESILRSQHKNFTGKDNSQYYFQSYLVIYFLLHAENGRYVDKFYRYFDEEYQTGPCSPDLFWSIMDELPANFCRNFYRWLRSL